MYLYTLKSISTTPNKFLTGKARCLYEAFTYHNHPQITCEYSKLYSPWVLLRTEHTTYHAHFNLLNYTLYTMKYLGIENVRGGPWTLPKLSPEEHAAIEKLLECEKIKGPKKLV
jgi:hypothetical protein